MGRPYAKELFELDETYAWARNAEIPGLGRAVARTGHLPLVAVGSGGSLTSANVMVQLHRRFTGALALSTTPLQLRSTLPDDRRASVWLVSAGGRNEDIRAALHAAAEREPTHLAVLCGSPQSELMRDAATRSWVDRIGVALPVSDGFLATNSALAFSMLFATSYLALVGGRLEHVDLSTLLASTCPDYQMLEERCGPLWHRPTTIVLHGARTAPAALDLESRFTEAALGLVQLADFRNFAHGRHHWLAKHPETSGVLALVGAEDERLAAATLSVLPAEVPTVALRFAGSLADVLIASIVLTMRLAAAAGAARRIDPGRPGVPDFGRRLYHMKTPRPTSFLEGERALSPDAEAAIVRKARSSVALLRTRGALDAWRNEFHAARSRLNGGTYGGVVSDYDGTLIETADRERPPEEGVVRALVRLLRGGVVLGIATGRGDSVTKDLRAVLPKDAWNSVLVGYHNGSIVQTLDEDPLLPNGDPAGSLQRAATALANERLLQGIARVRAAADQITVSALPCTSEEDLWLLVTETIRREGLNDLRVVRSSHSVDVMPTTSSKLHVVEAVRSRLSRGQEVLALGDRGRWPGNDYELLATRHALSVDEVSPDPAAAWNFCPIGQRGVSGVLLYFGVMKAKDGALRLSLGGES